MKKLSKVMRAAGELALALIVIMAGWLVSDMCKAHAGSVSSGVTTTGGSPAVFSYGAVPNLFMNFDARSIAGKVNGNTVPTWLDSSGNGYQATNVGTFQGLTAPLYITNIFGQNPAVYMDGSMMLATAPVFDASFDAGITVFIALRKMAANNDIIMIGTNNSLGWQFGGGGYLGDFGQAWTGTSDVIPAVRNGGSFGGTLMDARVSVGDTNFNNAYIDTLRLVFTNGIGYVYHAIDGLENQYGLDGDNNTAAFSAAMQAYGPLFIGYAENNSFKGWFGQILIYRRCLSRAECFLIENQLKIDWNINQRGLVIGVGDSHVNDPTATGAGWLEQLTGQMPALTNMYDVVNMGVGSAAAFQTYTNVVLNVVPVIKGKKTIAIVWCGANETNRFNLTWQIGASNVVNVCSALKGAGATVILLGQIPAASVAVPGFEGFRTNQNNFFRAHFFEWADAFVDIDTDTNHFYFGCDTNTVANGFPNPYYDPGHGHLLPAGDVFVAALVKPVLQSFLSTYTPGTNFNSIIVPAIGSFIRTNFVSGQIYTNTSGAPEIVSAKAALTTAAVSGIACLSLEMPGNETNSAGISTVGTSIAQNYTNSLTGIVTNGGTFTFTNRSTGAGNAAIPLGGQIMIQ